MNPTRSLWKQLTLFCVLTVLISNMGSLGTTTCTWNQSHGNEAHTAHCNVDVIFPLDILWEETLNRGAISGSPVANGDYLVLLCTLGTVTFDFNLVCYKVNRTGLQNVWTQPVAGSVQGATPAVTGDKVICPSRSTLLCFDLETGRMLWEIDLDSSPTTPTVIQDGLAAVTAGPDIPYGNGYFFLVDISSGEVAWTKTSIDGVPCQFFSVVTAGDDELFVYYATPDEEGIAAFNFQGELLWKRPGELAGKCVDEKAVVTLYYGGTLFAVSNPAILLALEHESGDVLWSYEGKTLLDVLSTDGSYLYAYDKMDGAVLCLDIKTGEEIWKSPPLFPEDRNLPIFFDKSLVSSQNCVFICRHTIEDVSTPRIYAFDRGTGEIIWTSEEVENLRGPLILYNDLLIVKTTYSLIAFGGSSTSSPPSGTTPESISPVAPLESPTSPTLMILVIIVVSGGILIMRYYFRKKSPK